MITMPTSQHEAAVAGVAWLVQLDFEAATLYLATAPVNVVVGDDTYLGLGSLLTVSELKESEDATAERLTISIALVDQAMLAAVLGPASTYRGRAVRLYLQLFDSGFKPAGTPVLRWSGTMDPVRVERQRNDNVLSGRIVLPCSRAGIFRARAYQGLRHTHAQQLLRYPGDLGLEYMQGLLEAPALWLSKRFQEV